LGFAQVGDVQSLTFAQLDTAGLTLLATDSGAQYLVVVANVAGNTDAITRYTLSGETHTVLPVALGTSQTPLPNRRAAAMPQPRVTRFAPTIPLPNGRLEARIREYERDHLAPYLATESRGPTTTSGQTLRRALVRPVPAVGATFTVHTLNGSGLAGTSATLCDKYTTTTATVKAVSTHAIVAIDTRSPAGFASTDYQTIAHEFDTLIYPTDSSYFGIPTDFDQNGHVIILFTPAVNQLTAAGKAVTDGFIGGFFFAGDLYPPSRCAESNQGELFYLLTPDPKGKYGNSFSTVLVRQMTRGTIAHEFQHMINAGNRIRVQAKSLESTWLDEALAHFAEDAVGRVAVGVSLQQTMTVDDFRTVSDSDATAFFFQNFARAKYYATAPDTIGPLVSHSRAAYDLAARGAEWALLRYVADWYGGGDVHHLIQQLATGPDTGTVNLTKRTGAPLDSLLGNWIVTMYTDHQGILNLPAKFNYASYQLRDLVSITDANVSGIYLPVDTLRGSASYTIGIPASSAAYFIIEQPAGANQSIKLTKSNGARPTDPGGRLYLVRLQ
jgi:hypothetical protein